MSFRPPYCCVGLALLLGCANEPVERAPLASDLCDDGPCKLPPRTGIGGVGAAPSDGGAPLPGGDAGQGVLLDFVVATRADASQTRDLANASLEVVVDAADGTRNRVQFGGSPISIDAIGRAPYWFRVRPLDEGLVTTLVPVPEAPQMLTLPVFERRVIEDVADNLTSPVALDPERGHAVLLFTRDGLPLPGVRVSVDGGRVAYDVGTLFSDALEETQERGAAALLNLPAVSFPGGSSEVLASFLGETVVIEIELAQGGVTLVTLRL